MENETKFFTLTHLILFSGCLVAGFYLRHWSQTGTGQFRRMGNMFNT